MSKKKEVIVYCEDLEFYEKTPTGTKKSEIEAPQMIAQAFVDHGDTAADYYIDLPPGGYNIEDSLLENGEKDPYPKTFPAPVGRLWGKQSNVGYYKYKDAEWQQPYPGSENFNFYYLADFNWAWWEWKISNQGKRDAYANPAAWKSAGETFRHRMNARGYQNGNKGTWLVNEFPPEVRIHPNYQECAEQLLKGLYGNGDDLPHLRGGVAVVGALPYPGYPPIGKLRQFKDSIYTNHLNEWFENATFWQEVHTNGAPRARWWLYETYAAPYTKKGQASRVLIPQNVLNAFITHPATRVAARLRNGKPVTDAYWTHVHTYTPLVSGALAGPAYGTHASTPLGDVTTLFANQLTAWKRWISDPNNPYPATRVAFVWKPSKPGAEPRTLADAKSLATFIAKHVHTATASW